MWQARTPPTRFIPLPGLAMVFVAAIAIHDGTPLYTIDTHFQKIARHTTLLLDRPAYGGSFIEVDDGLTSAPGT